MAHIFVLLCALIFPSLAMASGYTFISHIEHLIHVPQHVITFAIIGLAFVVVGTFYRAQISGVKNQVIPDKGITFRNIFEALGQFVYNLARNIMGEEEAKKYLTQP